MAHAFVRCILCLDLSIHRYSHRFFSWDLLYFMCGLVRIQLLLFLFRIGLGNFHNPSSLLIFIPLMERQRNTNERLNLKRIIIVALFFMMIGTSLELYLLGHYEGVQQLIPMFCIGLAILFAGILFFRRTHFMMNVFKGVMGLTALSGVYGTFLHLRSNYEFEQEIQPTTNGWNLFLESLSGALPTLAPGSMIVLALLGYSYVLLIKHKL